MTSPTVPRTAREQEPPASIADAEVQELVADLKKRAASRRDLASTCMMLDQAADTITRLAGEKAADRAMLNGEINRITIKLINAEAERDALRAKADDWQAMKDERDTAQYGYAALLDDTNIDIATLRAQLSAANAAIASVIVAESGIIVGQSQPLEFIKARAALRSDLGRRDIIQDNPND